MIREWTKEVDSLIRSDSVEDFIIYTNRTNLSLLTKIKPTIYEKNSFLIDKEPTLIEYAVFLDQFRSFNCMWCFFFIVNH